MNRWSMLVKLRASESIGNGVVGLRDHLVCEEHVNDAIDVLLRNVLLEH